MSPKVQMWLADIAPVPVQRVHHSSAAVHQPRQQMLAEIAEAVGMAAITRNMSTLLNGLQVDEAVFRGDVEKLVAGAKAAAKKSAAKPTALR